MDEDKASQRDSQVKPETVPTQPDASGPSKDLGWAGAPTSQVVRTVAAALLSAVLVLGALFLLWQTGSSGATA